MSAQTVLAVASAWLLADAAIVAAMLSTSGRRRTLSDCADVVARVHALDPQCGPGGAEPPTGAGLDRSRSSHRRRNLR